MTIADKINAIAQGNLSKGLECIGYAQISVVLDKLYEVYPSTDPSMLDLAFEQAVEDQKVRATLGDLPDVRRGMEVVSGYVFIKVESVYLR